MKLRFEPKYSIERNIRRATLYGLEVEVYFTYDNITYKALIRNNDFEDIEYNPPPASNELIDIFKKLMFVAVV